VKDQNKDTWIAQDLQVSSKKCNF